MRDHEGDLIVTAAGSSGRISSAFEAELIAARQAVLLVQDLCPSGSSIILEGDSSLVLAAMKGQGDDCSLMGPIINDLRYLLSHFLSGC